MLKLVDEIEVRAACEQMGLSTKTVYNWRWEDGLKCGKSRGVQLGETAEQSVEHLRDGFCTIFSIASTQLIRCDTLLLQPLQIFILRQTAQTINQQDFISRILLQPRRNGLLLEIPEVDQVDRAVFFCKERRQCMCV